MSYPIDCFYGAVSALAAHGPIKQRLVRAYEKNLKAIEDDDLPAKVQKSFTELRSLMHSVAPANGEGPVCATVRKMSTVEADECAQLIVEIHGGVMRYSETARTILPIVAKQSANVPPFLVKSS